MSKQDNCPDAVSLSVATGGVTNLLVVWQLYLSREWAEVTKVRAAGRSQECWARAHDFFRRVKLGQKLGYARFKRNGIRDSFRADNGFADKASHAVQVAGATVRLPRCCIVRSVVKFAQVSLQSVPRSVRLGANDEGNSKAKGTGICMPAAAARFAECGQTARKCNPGQGESTLARPGAHAYREVCKDALHKLTATLAMNYSRIGIRGDLNVSGTLKHGKLACAIADVGSFEFRRQLEYKAAMRRP